MNRRAEAACAPRPSAAPVAAALGLPLLLLLALAVSATASTLPSVGAPAVTFQPEGRWVDPWPGTEETTLLSGAGTPVLEWGIPFGPNDFPSRLEFRAAPAADAKLLPGERVSVPFVLGEVELRNGIITSYSPIGCWFEVGGRLADLDFDGAGILPMDLLGSSRFPVQLENSANIEGDPVASADRVAFGSIQGVLPPSVYHRTIAVPEQQTGRAALYARLRPSVSMLRLSTLREGDAAAASQGIFEIELLGFGDAGDSAYFPATSRTLDLAIDAGNHGNVLLPNHDGPIQVVIRGSATMPIESIDRDQFVLVGAMAIPLAPRSIEAVDVTGARGRNRPDGQLDLVLEFTAADIERSAGDLADARSAGVVSGQRRVPLALHGRTLDGQELRGDGLMVYAGSETAREESATHGLSGAVTAVTAVDGEADAMLEAVGGLQLSVRQRPGRIETSAAGAPGQDVRFTVHDVRGRAIATQRCRAQLDGRVDFAWSTSGVAPGIYFLRAESDRSAARAKLVVMR